MKRLLLILALFLSSVVGACCTTQTDVLTAPVAQVASAAEVKLKITLTDQTPRKVASIVFSSHIEPASADALEGALESLPADVELVLLVLDSVGGHLKEARRIARAIENSPRPVVCVADGMVASGAYYVLQSCPLRLMTSRSHLLIHEAYNNVGPSVVEARADLAALDSANAAMAWQNCHRLRIPQELCVAKYKGVDWWLGADEAMAVGAVDDVVSTPAEALNVLANLPDARPLSP